MSTIEEFSPKDLAGRLNVSPKTIYQAIKDGHLKCTKRNKRVFRITSQDAAEWWTGGKKL